MFTFFFQGASEYVRNQPLPFDALMIDTLFGMVGAELFLKYPVRNFTFDGITDEIMNATATFTQSNVPLPIPFDKFGWFYEVSVG